MSGRERWAKGIFGEKKSRYGARAVAARPGAIASLVLSREEGEPRVTTKRRSSAHLPQPMKQHGGHVQELCARALLVVWRHVVQLGTAAKLHDTRQPLIRDKRTSRLDQDASLHAYTLSTDRRIIQTCQRRTNSSQICSVSSPHSIAPWGRDKTIWMASPSILLPTKRLQRPRNGSEGVPTHQSALYIV